VPIGIAIAGANAHDQALFRATLRSIPIPRPLAQRGRRQHLCLDKGYLGAPVDRCARRSGYVPHVPPRAKDRKAPRRGHKSHRWVVEACHSWTNRSRRLLIRWEKLARNYLGFIHLQFAYTLLSQSWVLG
jgi:transposase